MRLVRRVLLLLAMTGAMQAAAHDSWLTVDAKGQLFLATGSRYPVADAPPVPAPASCVQGSCWVETGETEIELTPALVDAYLLEIRPSAEVVRRWETMREAGVAWRERYAKFARIELAGGTARVAAGAALEILLEGTRLPVALKPATFRVLSHRLPVADLSVELVSESGSHSAWSRSGTDGRFTFAPRHAGRYLLRATWLQPDGAQWRSRFATLAFEARN